MRLSITLTAAAVAILTTTCGAQAQETNFGSWSGFYGGAQIGYGWGDSNGHIEGEFEKVYDLVPDIGASAGQRARDATLDNGYSSSVNGLLGGVHVGGNLQVSGFVFGFEGDYDWSSADGSKSLSPEVSINGATQTALDNGTTSIVGDPKVNIDSELENVASIRGRLGYGTSKFLVYGTAGWAVADANVSVTSVNPTAGFPGGKFSVSDTLSGYVVGGGVEYRLSQSISLRTEVLHYNLGSLKYEFESEVASNNIEEAEGKQDFEFTQVRAGLSFHLN